MVRERHEVKKNSEAVVGRKGRKIQRYAIRGVKMHVPVRMEPVKPPMMTVKHRM
jgi:hypothetical protein